MIEELIKSAIKKIGKRHYEVGNPVTRVINREVYDLDYSKDKTEPENNFVNYLVAYILVELDKKDITEIENSTIFPQAQLYKKLVNKAENKQLISDFEISNGLYPDLVFHKDQDDNRPENQKIAIECKIDKNLTYDEFSRDFAKLIVYISEINFQKSIYIIANMPESIIIEYLRRFKLKYNGFTEQLNKMEIWVKNADEDLIIINCS